MELRDLHLTKQLDTILKYLLDNEKNDNDLILIKKLLLINYEINCTIEYLKLILDKLILDKSVVFEPRNILIHKGGFLEIGDTMATTSDHHEIRNFYFITIDGISILQIEGGYSGRVDSKNQQKATLRKLEIEQKENQNNILFLTIILAVVAVPTMIYSILQIVDWYINHSSSCCN
jgi:hypothetical protein